MAELDILEQLPRGVIVLEADAKVQYANVRARKLLRLSYAKTIQRGDGLLEFVGADERERWEKLLRTVLGGSDSQIEVEREREDGVNQVLRLEAQFQGGDRNGGRVVLIVEDISARRLYEDGLLSMHAALHQSSRTRDTLLSIIGHDLRSPIAQLNALLYMLRYSTEDLDTSKVNEYAETLEEFTRHLGATLNNLLSWSNSHREGIEPQLQKVDLVPVADEALGLLQLDAISKEVTLVHEPQAEFSVTTDRELMAYVIRNLISNAIKFSSSGGSVWVEHRLEDAFYQLRIVDQGVGMERAQIEKVLEGEQLESTEGTLGEKGVGLGLSLAREFIAMLKGEITIESLPGEGTTVSVRLPNSSLEGENSL